MEATALTGRERTVAAQIERGRAASRIVDRVHHALLAALAFALLAVVALIAWECVRGAMPAIVALGPRFLVSTEWDPVADKFGALPYLYGTAVSSALALLLAIPLGVGTAVYLAELAPRGAGAAVAFVVELLAAIPSIVYGIWGLFVLAPFLRSYVEPWLATHAGFLPLFQGFPFGIGMLNAALVLTVMVVPTIVSISREVLLSMPRSLRAGGARTRGHARRGDRRDARHRAARPARRDHPRARARARRDDGGDDGDRQHQPDLGFAVRAGRDDGERDRERVHRGDGEDPSRRAHRGRARAARRDRDREPGRAPARHLEHGRTS
jgi:hypothetical protein